jgi:hypothetical protein
MNIHGTVTPVKGRTDSLPVQPNCKKYKREVNTHLKLFIFCNQWTPLAQQFETASEKYIT